MAIYSDLNQYDPVAQPLLTNEEAIYQSLDNIFSTIPGERLFNPEFGTDTDQLPFELNDDDTSLLIFHIFIGSIDRWETRVEIDETITKVEPIIEENKFNIDLAFSIIGFDDQIFQHTGVVSS